MTTDEAIRAAAARIAAAGDSAPRAARDPVNLPMIRNWLEAIAPPGPGDQDLDTAPPSMIQVWTMPGLAGTRAGDDPLGLINQVMDEAGFTSVVATNCDQAYQRYLKPGEQLTVRGRLLDVTGPKRTALGEGWFVTTRSSWFSADELVATMDFRVLKFRPSPAPAAATSTTSTTPAATSTTPTTPTTTSTTPTTPTTTSANPASLMRPLVTPDTAFFWAGTAAGELRIQRCPGCGALRHPPGPMCPACGTPGDGGYLVAAGTGEVFSYVVHHHPPVPGKKLPMVVALVQLPEGVRMVGEMPGVVPDRVRIGLPVQVTFARVDDDLVLPAWRPAQGTLPDRVIEVTPTFVISSALATRDFYEVHHDRDLAVRRGSKDIFINILTTTGLVERYVSAWVPGAAVREVSIRLGVPCYAGETLTLSGQVIADADDEQVIAVTGRCSLGDHVTATVRITR